MAGRGGVYNETMSVEAIPALPPRDTSGGIDDAGFATVYSGVPCHVHQLSPRQMGDFAEAGYQATHQVATEQAGILAGQRLRLEDDTLLRVTMVQHVRGKQGVDDYYRVLADEVRLE